MRVKSFSVKASRRQKTEILTAKPLVSAAFSENSLPQAISPEDFRLNLSGCTLYVTPSAIFSGDGLVPLSPGEYCLLRTLARHLNTPVLRQTLFRVLSCFSGKKSARLVDACVFRLRKKIALCFSGSKDISRPLTKRRIFVRQVRGVGYGLWNTV